LSRAVVKVYQPGAALSRCTRLIESNVPGPADAKDLEIDAASQADHFLVLTAMDVYLGAREVAAWYVERLHGNSQIDGDTRHLAGVALGVLGRDGIVLVKAKGYAAT
jgi:hypothetical protein